jgi:hypothetical protein
MYVTHMEKLENVFDDEGRFVVLTRRSASGRNSGHCHCGRSVDYLKKPVEGGLPRTETALRAGNTRLWSTLGRSLCQLWTSSKDPTPQLTAEPQGGIEQEQQKHSDNK